MTVKDLQEQLEDMIKYEALSPDAEVIISIGIRQGEDPKLIIGPNHTLKFIIYESY